MSSTDQYRHPLPVFPSGYVLGVFLKAFNADIADTFGYCVDIDGDTMVVGAQAEDSGVASDPNNNASSFAGAAYVFARVNGRWAQQAYLKASPPVGGSNYGFAVGVSGDTVAVGSRAQGVHVYTRTGHIWTEQQHIFSSNFAAGDIFGSALAIDGDTLVVGAAGEDGSGTGVNPANNNLSTNSGAAYVFTRTAGVWSEQAYIKASNTGANDQFGNTVAVSGDTIVVGAINEDSNAVNVGGNQLDNSVANAGAAYIFNRVAGVWSQQAYIKAAVASPGAGFTTSFGTSVGISGDTVIVSSLSAIGATGAVYTFERVAGVWSAHSTLVASDASMVARYGLSVGIDGDRVIVGAPQHPIKGAFYSFLRVAGVWSEDAIVEAQYSGSNDGFGGVIPAAGSQSVAVAVSGNFYAVGAYQESSVSDWVNGNEKNNSLSTSGAAYVFVHTP